MKILTANEMQQTDRATVERFGVSMQALMEQAGASVATFVAKQYANAAHILFLCGTGNNGGDGYVAARLLAQAGRSVHVLVLGDMQKLHGEASAMYEALQATHARIEQVAEEASLTLVDAAFKTASLVVDAVVGTGIKPPLRGIAAAVRDRLSATNLPVVSVDLPSGWDADAVVQKAEGAYPSDAVVTFTAPKMAHAFGHLTRRTFGPVVVAPIGSPDEAILSANQLQWTGASKQMTEAPRPIQANKGMFGHALIVGGSLGKAGAPAMSSLSCLRSGAGLVTAAVPRSIVPTVAAIAPELMCAPLPDDHNGVVDTDAVEALLALTEKIKVLAIGPGISTTGNSSYVVRRIVEETSMPIVIDADGLNAFAGHADLLNGKTRPMVLTPHPGEMARLLGTTIPAVEADRVHIARRFATEHQVTLVLKGWRTLVAHPDGSIAVNTSGNPALAKGGSGDILTGIVAAMMAQHPDRIADAVNAAVYVHGLAADLAVQRLDEHSVLASDVIACLSHAFQTRVQDADGFTWLTGIQR